MTNNQQLMTIGDVHRLFGFQRQYSLSFNPPLSLEPVSDFEQQELIQIRNDFDQYLVDGKALEGIIKALTILPLLRLTGSYRYPIKLQIEEGIGRIRIQDEDTDITGRLDVVTVNKASQVDPKFWVLIIEAKNSGVEATEGLPQLLTYAYNSLEHQDSIWGLATNGMRYQFVYIQPGSPPTYHLMPFLNLIEPNPPIQLIQVLKAICKL